MFKLIEALKKFIHLSDKLIERLLLLLIYLRCNWKGRSIRSNWKYHNFSIIKVLIVVSIKIYTKNLRTIKIQFYWFHPPIFSLGIIISTIINKSSVKAHKITILNVANCQYCQWNAINVENFKPHKTQNHGHSFQSSNIQSMYK